MTVSGQPVRSRTVAWPVAAIVNIRPAAWVAIAVPRRRRGRDGEDLLGTQPIQRAGGSRVAPPTADVLGLTTAARYAPILLLSPYAGLLVDRYAKRHVLLATQLGLGLVSAALGAAVLTGNIRLWQVVALALVFGTLSAVDNSARQAFVQEVVGRDLVRNAVTLNTTLVNVARVIGPTVAAVLASTVGLGWCFVVNAVRFGFVIVSLLSLDTRRLHPVPPVPRRRGQLRAGLRYAARVPEIARPLPMMALIGTFTFEFEVSLPGCTRRSAHSTRLASGLVSRRHMFWCSVTFVPGLSTAGTSGAKSHGDVMPAHQDGADACCMHMRNSMRALSAAHQRSSALFFPPEKSAVRYVHSRQVRAQRKAVRGRP